MPNPIPTFVFLLSMLFAPPALAEEDLAEVLSGINSDLDAAESRGERKQVWANGVEALSDFLEKNPNSAEANFQKGRYLFYLERDEDARAAYLAAITHDPKHIQAHFMAGVLGKYSDNREEAEASFRTVLELDPKHIDAHIELGRLLSGAGKTGESEKYFRAVLDIDSNHAEANHEIGMIHLGNDHHKEALPFLRTASEQESDNFQFLWNLGQCRQNLGMHKEALSDFLSIQKQEPNDWEAFEKIIQLLDSLGKDELRDEWLVRIEDLKNSGDVPDLEKRGFFIRDQFAEGDYYVFGLEYFELIGERAVKYSFQVEKKDEPDYEFRIACGSYDFTNQIAQDLGELPPNMRRYHLDGYAPSAHYTYRFFDGNPGYEVVKNLVIEILRENLEAITSSTYSPESEKEEE